MSPILVADSIATDLDSYPIKDADLIFQNPKIKNWNFIVYLVQNYPFFEEKKKMDKA